jgi:NADH dehydrogenase FAD-containing subunit
MPTQVLVVGGGYAGVMAADRLSGRDDIAVTVVNPRPEFVERIRLHQLVGGSDDAVEAFDDVLAPGVRLVVDEVTRIDVARRRVSLGGGGSLEYDHLVYAVGSRPGAPGFAGAEHAYPIATLEAARRLRQALDDAADAPVTVVGAGPTGIETAAELAETGRRVTLVCGGRLGPYFHPHARRATRRRLESLGVTVLDEVSVVRVDPDAVELSDGRRLRSGVTVSTTGFEVPDLARRSGLSTDAAGRLLTDETLTSVDDDRVVGAGDAVAPSGRPQRMSCQAAMPLGAQAAQTVLSRIAGTAPAPITNGFVAQCVSLGRSAGTFQAARMDDTAVWLSVGGRPGAVIKELVCAQVLAALRREARRPGSFWWPAYRGRARLLAASGEASGEVSGEASGEERASVA